MDKQEILDFVKNLNVNDFFDVPTQYSKIYDKLEVVSAPKSEPTFTKFNDSANITFEINHITSGVKFETEESSILLANYQQIQDNLITEDYLKKKIATHVRKIIADKENDAVNILTHALLSNENGISNFLKIQLSKESLKRAIGNVSKIKDQSGFCNFTPKTLLVGSDNYFAAHDLDFEYYFAEHFPNGIIVNPYLPPNFAAILTANNDGSNPFKLYQRAEPEFWIWVDFATRDIFFATKERYAFVCSDWRGIYGISL